MTSRFTFDTPRFVDRNPYVDIRSLHDFLHLCSQYDSAHQAGNYELGDRIVQEILETYLSSDNDTPSSNVLLSASGITPCSGANIAKKQALRCAIDATTLGRVMERIQGEDSMTKVNGRHNGYATSNGGHLPQDLFNDVRDEVENYICSRISLRIMESPYSNGCSDGIGHDEASLEHLFSSQSTVNSSTISRSLPLTINLSDHDVLPDDPVSPLASTATCLSPEFIRETETNVDVRLALLVDRDLHIQSHRSDRVLDEVPINTVPDETGETSPIPDEESSITVDSADSNNPHERSRQLHVTLAQFAWARTLFSQVSRQYILNPVRPDAILDEHLARVWRDRARVMMQEDERDGLPTLQRPKRRTKRMRVYSRCHLRNNVSQLAAGSRENVAVNREPVFEPQQHTPMKTSCHISSVSNDVFSNSLTEWNRCCQFPNCSNSSSVWCSDGSYVRKPSQYLRSPHTERSPPCHLHHYHHHHHHHHYHQFRSGCNSDHQLLHPNCQQSLCTENGSDRSSYMHIQNESNLFPEDLDGSEYVDQCTHTTRNTQCMSILHDAAEHKAASVQKPFTGKLSQASGADDIAMSFKLLPQMRRSISTVDAEVECEVQNKINQFNCFFKQCKATSVLSSVSPNRRRYFTSSGALEGGRSILPVGEIASGIIVVCTLPGQMWPHVTYCPQRQPLTLDWFKQIVLGKFCESPDYAEPNRRWRYFFKCASDEFAPGVVYQECTLNNQLVPLWKGQVWAKIEVDD